MRPFTKDGAFLPAAPEGGKNLRQLAVRGAGATIFSGATTLGIQIVATVVLARILTPTDFGLVAMVTTFSLLLTNFGLNGFTEAIVQRAELDHALASNLFWINLSGGILLTAGFAAAGHLLARFYHDPRIVMVTVALSATIFLTSASVIHLALLKRAMRFPTVSANDIVAKAGSVAVAVGLGWAGCGYWALVAGAVTLPASTCAGAWILCHWLPGIPQKHKGTRPMLWFAFHTYGRFSLGYFTNNLDNLLIGWRLGPMSLGFYKKAYDLFVLPTSQLSSPLTIVAVSALSRLQKDYAQYRRYLLNALGVMAFIGMGLSGALTLAGKDLILVLLGPKWGESGRIFTFFGPGVGAVLLYGTHQWIHLSIGRADRWLRWGFVDLAVTAVFLVGGLHWGAVGVALGWVMSSWIITLPALWYACQPIHLGLAPIVQSMWRYVFSALIAGSGAALLLRGTALFASMPGTPGAAVRVTADSMLFTIFYVAAVVALHRGWAPVNQVTGLMRDMVARKFSNSGSSSEPSTATVLPVTEHLAAYSEQAR